jgi:hypothetical protein
VQRRWDKSKNAYPAGEKLSRRPIYDWGMRPEDMLADFAYASVKNGKVS